MIMCKLSGLYKTYHADNKNIEAIVNCDLEVNEGECVAICGPKASGKTTLLRMIGGLERPTKGNVYINQRNITCFNDDELVKMRRKEIGYLFQLDSIIPELNVHENIILPAILAHNKYNETYYRALIAQFQLKDVLSLHPKWLSEYQMQSILYARALINNPNIILVDEEAGVCEKMNLRTMDFLSAMLSQYHKTVILVSNEENINRIADHIIRLEHGKVIENKRIS